MPDTACFSRAGRVLKSRVLGARPFGAWPLERVRVTKLWLGTRKWSGSRHGPADDRTAANTSHWRPPVLDDSRIRNARSRAGARPIAPSSTAIRTRAVRRADLPRPRAMGPNVGQQPHCDPAADDDRGDRDEDDHQHVGAIRRGGAGSPTACSRSRPLSRDRTRCPRCPASQGTTRCRHRQAVVARVPRRARPVVRIRPQVRPGALHPRARCRPARQDAADS
jgi:hypothetical protein